MLAFRCVVPKNNTPLCSVEVYGLPDRGYECRGICSADCLLLFAARLLVLCHGNSAGQEGPGFCRCQDCFQVRTRGFGIDSGQAKASWGRESATPASWP